MKKLTALILTALLALLLGAAAAEENSLSFRSMAGLDAIRQKLDDGVTFDTVYYTDGYGFSDSEFTTTNREEIRALWEALNQITVRGRTDESVTDWYPQILFRFSDGSQAGVCFEAHRLSLSTPWPGANYELENDGEFWRLTKEMVMRYKDSVHPKKEYRTAPWEGLYRIGIRAVSAGSMDLALYTEDRYDRNDVENIALGETVMIGGKAYTAAALLICGTCDSDGDGKADRSCTLVKDPDLYREMTEKVETATCFDYENRPAGFELSHYELIPEGGFDGYIVFEAIAEDGENECRAAVNDWSPCTYAGVASVTLPLPENFEYEDYAGNMGGAEAFLADADPDRYTPYNTFARFENGQPVKISHSDYPVGPEE